MRSFYAKKTKRNNSEKIEFEHIDIFKAIFENESPQVVSFPFEKFNHPDIQSFNVVYSLDVQPRSNGVFTALCNVVKSDDISSSKEKIKGIFEKLPPWMVSHILQDYKKYETQWVQYIVDNIQDFCKTRADSKYYWNILKYTNIENVFKNKKLTVEQLFWIDTNASTEAFNEKDFMIKLKDSLLPWINPGMYKEMKSKDDNTRTNIDYEKQRQQMLDGSFEGEDDLDIIK